MIFYEMQIWKQYIWLLLLYFCLLIKLATHSHSKDIQTFHPPRMSFLRYGSKLMVHGRNFRRSFTFSGVLWLSLLARNASILRGFLSISSSGSISLDTGIFSDILKFFFHTLNLSLIHRFYTQHVFLINTSLL